MSPAARLRGRASGLLIVLLLAACADQASLSSDSPQVQALHERCVEAMVRSACVASMDTSNAVTPPASPVVMLAGVGAVDARFYARLRTAGEDMCEILILPCDKTWEGSECRTARALWPGSEQKADVVARTMSVSD